MLATNADTAPEPEPTSTHINGLHIDKQQQPNVVVTTVQKQTTTYISNNSNITPYMLGMSEFCDSACAEFCADLANMRRIGRRAKN